MPKIKHYSPQLSRDLVSRLYYEAKSQRLPMTKLVSKIIEEALGNKKRINRPRVAADQHITEPS